MPISHAANYQDTHCHKSQNYFFGLLVIMVVLLICHLYRMAEIGSQKRLKISVSFPADQTPQINVFSPGVSCSEVDRNSCSIPFESCRSVSFITHQIRKRKREKSQFRTRVEELVKSIVKQATCPLFSTYAVCIARN
ncbi:MAG: hypothetical protein ACJA13_002363 [Paraglaciecola sp.]|jgi:hypothetical protein